jgi:predicted transcriptional regulator
MSYRTTFAFDGDTMRRLKNLAARWQVSQAEVVRRALSQAESQSPPDAVDPLEALNAYHRAGGLDRGKAEAYLREVSEDRAHWRSS